MALTVQKTRETKKQNQNVEKEEGFEETKGETMEEISNETEIESYEKKEDAFVDTVDLTEGLKTQFLNKHFFFEYKGQAWTKANDVARYLDFKEARNIIYYHISDSDKIVFKQFTNNVQNSILSGMSYLITHPKFNIHPETIFINDEGVFDLFMKSRKPIAKAMKRWLVYEVIPSIIRTGTYSISAIPLPQSTIQSVAVADPRSTVCHNLKGFPISSMKSAIYILQLPLLNMYKFGYSNNLINRFKQHEYDFGEIIIELILEAPDIQEIEKRLKNEIRSHGINTVYEIDGRKLKELFVPDYFNQVCEIVKNIVDNYKTDTFTTSQNHEYRMICEQTKIACEETKQKECDVQILQLRIELEKVIRKRKVDTV
jgi:prophage antirepressor-like protein